MHTRHYGLGAEALDDKTGAGRTGRDRRPDPGARPELTELTRHTADRVAQQVVRAVIKHENRILLQRPTDDLREKDGNLSDETRSILDKYMREADPQQVIGWARARSPLSYVDSIDRNRPATLMIQSWNETVFLPDQMGRFNDRLTGPHQLEVVPGEHAAAETSGLLGLPNESWEHVYRWFDKHLRGPGNPAHEPPVVAKPRCGTDRPRESYPDWQHVANRAERFTMAPGGKLSAGETGGTSQPTTIKSGVDTLADGGLPLVTYTAEALSGHPSATFLPAVDRKHGAVWTSDPLPENRRLRGVPHLHTTIKPSTADGMLVSYLYDVDQVGQAKWSARAVPPTSSTFGSSASRKPSTRTDSGVGSTLSGPRTTYMRTSPRTPATEPSSAKHYPSRWPSSTATRARPIRCGPRSPTTTRWKGFSR